MNFYRLIGEAIRDIEQHGFDSQARIEMWLMRIREAAVKAMLPESTLMRNLNNMMQGIYRKLIERGDILKIHQGVSRFTLDRIRPAMRTELDRRIMASASLIKLNRQEMIEKTMRRFIGWSTSIPAGGSKSVDKKDVKNDIRKSLEELPFAERRVMIDQGHKFTSELNNIVATDGGAIAARWHSHWRQPNYNYRKDHKERDEQIYTIRGNWALHAGLMKAGPAGYTDEITKPAEEPFCRCNYEYIYNIRDLPIEMLTKKGNEQLWKARAINA